MRAADDVGYLEMIVITPEIAIDDKDLAYKFIHASGPGGQNVNKVATAVQLRFNVQGAHCIDAPMRSRIARLAGRRLTSEGVLILESSRHRTRERNRQDALERLLAILRKAAEPEKRRHRTRPTLAARQRRLDSKRRRAHTKRLRQGPEEQH